MMRHTYWTAGVLAAALAAGGSAEAQGNRADRLERQAEKARERAERLEEKAERTRRVGHDRNSGRQDPRSRTDADVRFGGLDTNDDNVISRAEWRGNLTSFRQHDWNRDGVISGDEVRTGEVRAGGGRWDEFYRRDSDGNGVLTRAEFGGHGGNFNAMDTNGDGLLNGNEFVSRGGRTGGPIGDVGGGDMAWRDVQFHEMDRDDDNALEKLEWRGSALHFDMLDRDNDGRIEGWEYSSPDQLSTWYRNMDRDRDGIVERHEWRGDRREFDQPSPPSSVTFTPRASACIATSVASVNEPGTKSTSGRNSAAAASWVVKSVSSGR